MRAFHVFNQYYDEQRPRATGHNIIANSEEHALAIAEKHKIGTPFGRICEKRQVIFSCSIKEMKERQKRRKWALWFENRQGQLIALYPWKGIIIGKII